MRRALVVAEAALGVLFDRAAQDEHALVEVWAAGEASSAGEKVVEKAQTKPWGYAGPPNVWASTSDA